MAGPVDQGQTYRYRQTVKDSAGVLANAGTVTFTITLPDGTTTAPTVVNSSTGVYDIAYTTSQFGLHSIRGSATGGTLGSEFDWWTDAFVVEEPGRQIVGLDEASAHLRAAGVITSDSDREQLRWLCIAATDAVERDVDRIFTRRSIVEVHDGGKTGIKLRSGPILSVTSVVESSVTLSASDYVLDSNAQVLWRKPYGALWVTDWQNVTVTVVAGMVAPPAAARLTALYVVQSLWQSSQQAPHPFLDEAGLESATFAGLSVLSGLPQPLRNAYRSLQSTGVA